ncbi:hypothetical protein RJD40_18005 [Vibrio scophthalmi]
MHVVTLDQEEQHFQAFLEQDLFSFMLFRHNDDVLSITMTLVPPLSFRG